MMMAEGRGEDNEPRSLEGTVPDHSGGLGKAASGLCLHGACVAGFCVIVYKPVSGVSRGSVGAGDEVLVSEIPNMRK